MRRQFYAIYLINAFEGLAGSLIGIFIPIYLLQIGYPLGRVLFFLMEWNLWACVWFFVAGYLSEKVGLKKLMIIRLPLLLLYFWLIYHLPQTHFPLSILAALNGACLAFFWFPLHVFFSRRLRGEHSEEVGRFFAYPQFVIIFAPLIGAGITIYAGYNYLFFAAGVIYLCSIAPLIWIEPVKTQARLYPKLLLEYFRRYRGYLKIEIIENMREDAEAFLWPIFVFVALGSLSALESQTIHTSIGSFAKTGLASVGLISSLASLGSIGFNLVVGNLSGKINKARLIKTGAVFSVVIWLARFFVTYPAYYYLLTIAASLAGVILLIPLTSIMYKLAKEKVAEEFIIFREIPVALGRSLVYGIAAILAPQLENVFFVVASVIALFLLFDFNKIIKIKG